MNYVVKLTTLWPGLPRLWHRGEWSALLTAGGFAVLLNWLLTTTLLWPEVAPVSVRMIGWLGLAVWWPIAVVAALRELPQTLAATDDDPQMGLFISAQAEYLKGIPIPKMLKRDEDSLSILVRCILAAKRIGEEAAAQFIEDLIDACVFECYFREHMEERDLLFLNDLAPHLASYDLSGSESKQREFLNHLHRTLNAAASKIRNRLVRLSADSPELLAVIKKGGKA